MNGAALGERAATVAAVLALVCWEWGARADELERALELANEGRLAEARQVILPIVEQQPDHFRARLLQGILRVREEGFDDAIRIFGALRDAYPERSEPYNNLAVVYVAQGRLDEAHAALQSAIAREPELHTAHENLSDLYIRLARRSTLRARALSDASGSSSSEDAFRPGANSGASGDRPLTVQELQPGEGLAANEEAGAASTRVCVRVTGITAVADATEAEAWLWDAGAEVTFREGQHEFVKYHWVYQPPLPSRAEAIAEVEAMQASGVEDIALIRHGDLANGISLGIYRSTDNLRRRISDLESMGYPVQYETTSETVRHYWLEAEFAAVPLALIADWPERFPDQSIEIVACELAM